MRTSLIVHSQARFRMQTTPALQITQVTGFGIEFIALAIEFVNLANEFVPLAIEFVTLAIEFIALALEFVHNKIGSWRKHENMM